MLLLLSLASCKRKWTDQDRSDFMSGCLAGGALRDMGPDRAKAYCHCMLDKVMTRYPNANDARFISRDTAMTRIGRDCFKQP